MRLPPHCPVTFIRKLLESHSSRVIVSAADSLDKTVKMRCAWQESGLKMQGGDTLELRNAFMSLMFGIHRHDAHLAERHTIASL